MQLIKLPWELLSTHVFEALDAPACWNLGITSKAMWNYISTLDRARGAFPAWIELDEVEGRFARSLFPDSALGVRCTSTRMSGRWAPFSRDGLFEIRSMLVRLSPAVTARAMVGFARLGDDGPPTRVLAKRMYTGDYWVSAYDHDATFMAMVPYDLFERDVFVNLELYAIHGAGLPVYVHRL